MTEITFYGRTMVGHENSSFIYLCDYLLANLNKKYVAYHKFPYWTIFLKSAVKY